MKYLIQTYTNENDLVFDGFSGSFSTALAAEMLDRRWIACDISLDYCKIGEKRLSDYRAQGKLKLK
jgi:DNA modification methylase